jgi:UDP-N-acetyl-2-amino-2-deoxyglucuronate dehydrogenase
MSKKFRFAVIGGTGGQGGHWVKRIAEWSKNEIFKIELVAICDKNQSGIEKRAKELGIVAYTDYENMYNEAELNGVVIATPHYLHAPMAISAAEHDINVLVEKPMCINLKQADEMRKAVKQNSVKLAVGFQHRFNPSFLGLKNAMQSGDLGDIFQLNMLYRHWREELYYETSSQVMDPKSNKAHGWRGHWATEGAGALANQMIHFLDTFQWLGGPIKSVSAISKVAKHTFPETDDNTNAIVEFMNNSMGLIQAGVAYEYGEESEFSVFGTKGALIHRHDMRNEKGEKLPYIDMRSEEIIKKKPLKSYIPTILDGDMQMFGALIEAIEEDDASKISVNVDEGRKSVELMRGILLSIIFEKKVTFPVHDADITPSLAHTFKDPAFE